jgi:carbohydrate-selective porin OprB
MKKKHNEMRSEQWINYAKYHTNPTAYVSLKVQKQLPERSDVSASRINVALSKREVES